MGDDSSKETVSSITATIKAILDKLYNGFILNDLLSKIIPGVIVLSTFNYISTDTFRQQIISPNFEWIVIVGLAWATGYTVQSFGETTGFIASWPREYYNENGHRKMWFQKIFGHIGNEKRISEWYDLYFGFCANATTDEKEYLSRFPTILNIVNNLSFSVFISATIHLLVQLYICDFVYCQNCYSLCILILISLVSLLFVTKVHRKRLYNFINRKK